MNPNLIKLINRAFEEATANNPPMTLRSGDAVDSYNSAIAYNEQLDQPTNKYLQQFAYWGMPHLDPVSWHYYLPFLINYSLRNATKDAPAESDLVVDATLWALRPPDREPSRFSLLTPQQEALIVEFLDSLAFDENSIYQEDAMQVLEEYWIPGATYREIERKHDVL